MGTISGLPGKIVWDVLGDIVFAIGVAEVGYSDLLARNT